jgi:hypothetical protein
MDSVLHTPSTAELLAVWEQAVGQPPAQRGLALLAAALPGTTGDELATLSVGRRDGYLLDLHEVAFGPRLTGVAACPACSEQLELSFAVADLRAAAGQPTEVEGDEPLAVEVSGYRVHFRLPNSRDLAVLPEPQGLDSEQELNDAGQILLSRCLLAVWRAGDAVEAPCAAELPPEVVEAVLERMAEADPQADLRLDLVCPACGHRWQAPFDILSFLWSELQAWAQRLLWQVHTLAWAHGWREADILAMSPLRRQAYLEMVGA